MRGSTQFRSDRRTVPPDATRHRRAALGGVLRRPTFPGNLLLSGYLLSTTVALGAWLLGLSLLGCLLVAWFGGALAVFVLGLRARRS